RELEVDGGEVGAVALGGHRLGDDDAAGVEVPAEDDLGGRRAEALGDRGDGGVLEVGAATEGRVRLDGDAVAEGAREDVGLLERRVDLDLVDDGQDVGGRDEPVEVVGEEVRDADRADGAVGVELLEGAPRLDVEVEARDGPVDEVEVDDVDAEGGAGV